MTRRIVIASAFLLASATLVGAAEPKPEPLDVLCLTDARPVVLRLAIAVDGKPLHEAWGNFADALFAHLDANKNDTLDGLELARLPQTLTLLTGRTGFPAPPPMTRDALAEYLRGNDLGPFRLPVPAVVRPQGGRFLRTGTAGMTEVLDKALMELLDTDKDGKLSPVELATAPALLAKLDADENELVGADGISGRPGPVRYYLDEVEGPPTRFEMLRLGRKADPLLAKRLLDRYRPKANDGAALPNRRLTKADFKLSAEAFTALDQDGDDELDAEELARFGGVCVPEVELAFQLGKVSAGERPAVVIAGGKAPVVATATGQGAEVAVEVPGLRLDFAPASGAVDFRGMYLDRFQQFDRDANGYLDDTEARTSGLFRELFPLLDADGKVFEKELRAALTAIQSLEAAASSGLVAADVAEAGRGLFGLFDTNGDGHLSPRELREMPKLAKQFATANDGSFTPTDVPRRFQVTLAGSLAAPQQIRRADGGANAPRPAVGPQWFQKMDRNRDGDVSRREFLGSADDFRRLDRDGDGLLDAREAEVTGKPAPR